MITRIVEEELKKQIGVLQKQVYELQEQNEHLIKQHIGEKEDNLNKKIEGLVRSIAIEKYIISFGLTILSIIFAILAFYGYSNMEDTISDNFDESISGYIADQYHITANKIYKKQLEQLKIDVNTATKGVKKEIQEIKGKANKIIGDANKKIDQVELLKEFYENELNAMSKMKKTMEVLLSSVQESLKNNKATENIDSINSIKENINSLKEEIGKINKKISMENAPIFLSDWEKQHSKVIIPDLFTVSVGNVTSGIGLVNLKIQGLEEVSWYSLNQGDTQVFSNDGEQYILVISGTNPKDETVKFMIYNLPKNILHLK